jgi:hypothetical protein
MTVRSNHSKLRVCARSLTSVGLRRVSIGPPIIVIERGSAGSSSDDISEIAPSTGTVGWHTDITWTSGPRWRMNSIA